MVLRLSPLLFALSLALAPVGVRAETRALLIGVGDYLQLDADLKGPPADVALMAEVLAARGVSDIRQLATGGAEVPTRAAILAAMEALALAAAPGDTVVFYFSGHGAQAPDASGDEGGGYDEILLPADATGWKGSIGAVENAILDDELQLWAQELLTRDVRLVGLLDACHSATGFRALGGVGVPRGLDAAVLGLPGEAPDLPDSDAAGLTGEFIFLYSSQSDQRSFEYPLADGSAWHGAFTLRLAEVLRHAPAASWADVLRASSDAMVQGAARQVPDGEGPLLSAPVFGEGVAALRMAVMGAEVQAGLLQGLELGAELAFYAEPGSAEVLGTALLSDVTARRATLAAPPPAGALWAELVTPAPPRPLVLGPPVVTDQGDYGPWLAALAAAGSGAPPDLVPVLSGGELALAGADGLLDGQGPGSSPRVRPMAGEAPAEALARVLDAARHSLRLRRVLAGLAGRSLTGKPPLEVGFSRRPAEMAGTGCAAPQTGAVAVDPAKGLQPCDQLWVSFRNVSGRPLDVSLLYFNADFTVTPVWPLRGLSNRLAPGEGARAGLQIAPGLPPALEEVMVVAVPVEDGAERVDLTRLAAPEMNRGFASAASGIEGWIEDRVVAPDDGSASRGFSTRPAAVMMVRQPVRVTGPDQ